MSNYVDNIKKKIDGVPTEVDIHDKRLADITGDSQTLLSLNASGNVVPVRTNSPVTSSNPVATMDDIDAGGGYIKPETGIPKSDLDASVQASLDKADISIPNTEKGANNGVATLDSAGKVPTSQLPSYVDDVLEFNSISDFPSTGETGKIYVAKNTNLTYRWGGSSYVEISPSLALGETDSTAYRGDRGKIAYDHSQITSGNPHNVTKSDVGLDNVDNTSDANKPISTATQTALDNKVDKVSGKGLSTNDFTNALLNKLNGIEAGAEVNVQSDWNEADTSSDAFILNKPSIPTATSDLTNDSNFVSDANYVHTDNNYTTAEKNKLAGIASGAEVNVQSDWNVTDSTSDAFIKNKPAIPTVNNGTLTIQKNGTDVATFTANQSAATTANIIVPTKTSDITNDSDFVSDADYVHTDNNYTTAEKTKLSGIASGAEVNVQSDWNVTSTSSDAFIKNKPSLATVATSGSYNDLTDKPTIPSGQVNSDWNATSGVAQILNKPTLATVATSGSYNDLSNKPTIPTVNNGTLTIKRNGTDIATFTANQSMASTADITVPTATSDLTNDSDFVSDANYVHTDNNFTTTEKNKLSGIASGAEVNQNAFSNVVIGSTTIAADTKTDTLTLVAGSNVTLTPDATNDKVTIAATDTTYSAGSGLSLFGTQFNHSNSVTAGTAGTSSATSGSTLAVPYVTYDAQGHVTASGTHTHTVTGFLTSHQTIKQDGVTGATVNRFGTCSTAAATAAKTVAITTGTFSLEAGAQVAVKFSNANTANSPTLNVGSTGAKNIFVNGAQITSGGNKALLAGTVIFIYDGTQYHLIGNYYDTNTSAVTGVKGNSESSYRTGNVNLTAANIGAATSDHTHTTTIAAGGTSTVNLSANTAYTLTAGGTSVVFKTPADNNTTYSAGTGLSLSNTTFNHSNSVTAGTAGTSSATSGSTLAVPYVTYDAQGHVTASGTHTHTVTGFSTTDTKNTAGSTDTSSKIFLVGATSQAANPQTYSDNQVYATNGQLDANKVRIAEAVTMVYDSTNKCLNFNFA